MTFSFQRKWISTSNLFRATSCNTSLWQINPISVGVSPPYTALSYKIIKNRSKYSIMGKNWSACFSGYFYYPLIEFWSGWKLVGLWVGEGRGLGGCSLGWNAKESWKEVLRYNIIIYMSFREVVPWYLIIMIWAARMPWQNTMFKIISQRVYFLPLVITVLWPNTTTFESSQRSYSWPKAAIVCCGQRSQHL